MWTVLNWRGTWSEWCVYQPYTDKGLSTGSSYALHTLCMVKEVQSGRDKTQQRENDSCACHVHRRYKLAVGPTSAGKLHLSQHTTQTLLQIHNNIQEQPPAYQSITMPSGNTTPDPSPSPSIEATNPHTGLINHAAHKQGAMSLCDCRIQPQYTNFVLIRGFRCH